MPNIQKTKQNPPIKLISDLETNDVVWIGQKLQNFELFNPKEIKYLQNLKYPIIKAINHDNLIDSVFIVVSNNLRAINSKMHRDDILLLVNDLTNELTEDFKIITIKEFELIVRNGIRKRYDTEKVQTIGLSVVNFNIWARSYLEEKGKLDQKIQDKINLDKIRNKKVVEVKYEDVINLIKEYHDHSVIEFNKLGSKELKCETANEYFLKTGLHLSANYVYKQLVKYNKLTADQLQQKIDSIVIKPQRKNEFTTMMNIVNSNKKYESKRILCCEFYLQLISKKK